MARRVTSTGRRIIRKKSKVNKPLIALITVLVLGLFSFLFSNSYYQNSINPVDKNDNKEYSVIIPVGASTLKIASILKENDLIKNENVFRLYCRLNKLDGKFKAGEYIFTKKMDVKSIVKDITNGNTHVEIIRITIPEGYEMRMIANKFETLGLCSSEAFMKAANSLDYNFDFLKELPKRDNQLEGYLFPDTYDFLKTSTPKDIVNRLLARFNDIYIKKYKSVADKKGLSMDKVITMASLIEREAKKDNERAEVSAVFYNRLNIKMRLQSCATVQYILKSRKDVLLYKDLEIDSPYNTYKNSGLPPGPIASPGEKSIISALYPDKTDYLYFVAKKDGSHIFSKTYAEHLTAKNSIENGR